ncbi:MAG: hypothetical protein ACSLE1_21395 [Sphingobium sp.]
MPDSFKKAQAIYGIRPDFSYAPILPNPGPLTSEDRLVFLHMEKTGGTTVHNILAKHFVQEEICPERLGKFLYWREEDLAPYRFFSSHASLRTIKSIPQPRKTLTILRDPIKRVQSHYIFWRSVADDIVTKEDLQHIRYMKRLNLKQLLSPSSLTVLPEFWNLYAHRLAGDLYVSSSGKPWRDEMEILDAALANLANITTLGLTEYSAISFQCMADDLGIPNLYNGERYNVSGNISEIDQIVFDEAADHLYRVTRLDQQIYDAANCVFEDRLRRGITIEGIFPAHLRTEQSDGHEAVFSAGENEYVLYGPYCALPAGRYKAAFLARFSPIQALGVDYAVKVDVCSDLGGSLHADRQIDIRWLSSDTFKPVTVEFTLLEATSNIEFRVICSGAPGLIVARGVGLVRL